MKKLMTVAAIVAVVVGSGAFYGGMKYAQGRGGRGNFTNLTPEQRQQLMANGSAGFRGGAGQGRGGMSGGFTVGEIISKEDKRITIKMPDGGSKIVFYSDATEVGKSISGTPADLKVGETVTTNGTANSDGSITAQSIQIRPIRPIVPAN